MILYLLQLIGTAAFASSGALSAGRKQLDLVGVAAISFATAMGGGTLRDLLLDRNPVLWMADPIYLLISVGTGLLTWALARIWIPPRRLLLFLDAGGLALFTISGVQIAEQSGQSPIIALVMGVVTGTAGGVIRDVLCGEIPLVFRRSELYASAALIGSGIYLGAEFLGVPMDIAALTGSGVIFFLRIAALKWKWHLPVFVLDEKA